MVDASSGETGVGTSRSVLEPLLAEGIEEDLFTGAAAAVGTIDGVAWETAVGERDPRSGEPVTGETLFDAASTTKAVVTTTVVHRLVEEGVLALSAPLGAYVPPLDGTERGEIPLRHLLTHTSGLQPYHYDPSWASPEAARRAIYGADLLAAEPGERFEYSCLNFVHLVDAARRATDSTLSELARRCVFEPAGMDGARMGPLGDGAPPAAVTYDHDRADRALAGEIHDPIAPALAGESGNAGCSRRRRTSPASHGPPDRPTTRRVRRRPPAGPGTIARMRENWTPDLERSHGLGWRLARECDPAPNWPRSSFGHTGYTGTSVWIDPEADRFAVLLTNEVYCGKGNGLSRLRERFHGAVAGGRC